MIRWVRLVAFIAFCALWWFVISGYMVRPRTYWPVIIWLAVSLLAGGWHVRALYRFHRILQAVRRDEWLGLAEKGSAIFAVNQRFRYMVRVMESALAIIIGVFGFYAIQNPSFQLHNNGYQRLTVTFFIGSIAATGYLTIRDLRVVKWAQREAHQEDIALGRPAITLELQEKLIRRLEEEGYAYPTPPEERQPNGPSSNPS